MATLDELLKIDGVVAAGEFTADGKLVDHKAKMDMSPEMAAMTAQYCATVTMMFNTLAGAFSQLSKMKCIGAAPVAGHVIESAEGFISRLELRGQDSSQRPAAIRVT